MKRKQYDYYDTCNVLSYEEKEIFEKIVELFPSIVDYKIEDDSDYDEDGLELCSGYSIRIKIDTNLYNGREEILIRGFNMYLLEDLE